MKKVWAVTAGRYSDFHLVGIFSTRKNAEKCVSHYNQATEYVSDKSKVVPYTLDPGINELNMGYQFYRVRMTYTGDVTEIELVRFDPCDVDSIGTDIKGCLYIYVFGADTNQAIKAANERRIQYLTTHQLCGHLLSSIVSSDEGTSYCKECNDIAKENES